MFQILEPNERRRQIKSYTIYFSSSEFFYQKKVEQEIIQNILMREM